MASLPRSPRPNVAAAIGTGRSWRDFRSYKFAFLRSSPCRFARRRWRVAARGLMGRAMNEAAPRAGTRLTARALIVGDRIDTAGLERPDMIAATPLAFRVGSNGMV